VSKKVIIRVKILIVAPLLPGVDQAEIPEVASGHEATILRGHVTIGEMESALKLKQYDALHFMQHGKYGALQLGDGKWVSADRLALAVGNQSALRFLFFNACSSASVAAACHTTTGVSCLFHEAPIDDRVAVSVASEFYNALNQGVSLARATEVANEAGRRTAEDASAPFTRLVLINGGEKVAQVVVRLEECFGTLAVRLGEIDNRLERVEFKVDDLSRRKLMPAVIVLLAGLILAQVLTPWVQLWLRVP
jgi:hypothetical protein